ncbi:DUF2059 domain-containing protein [Aquibium oceanicum]|uniref:DUF2059 domain-containing protein n=1 Tax=Aquibium oceanicum TaxID=1670800 RepID=A0A1L3SSL3_9HYPH|nr:DUF2059 domain-containing protein [Aquibium oceanicum]APH72423.1 hypothetical protein BSQ44_14445 [Aquibium oceanicum]
MILKQSARRLATAIAAAAFLAGAAPVLAQDISDTHLKAARGALDALQATQQYDLILPFAARALKEELIRKDPNLQDLIIATVDQKALELASRRGDLEREAALAYARNFDEAQLNAIAEFYSSEAGKALIEKGPEIIRDLDQAAEIWQRGLARDLAAAVGEELQAQAPQSAATPAPAGTEAAPAQ